MTPIDRPPPLARLLPHWLLPHRLLPVLNLLGSAVLGLWLLGWQGLLLGPLVFAAVLALAWAQAWLGRRLAALPWPTPNPAPAPPQRPGSPPPPPGRDLVAEAAQALLRRGGVFLAGFLREEALPYTVLNLVLLALVGCLVYGLDFAFWLALAAVPVVLLVLMAMSLRGQVESDESAEDEAA